MYNPADLGKRYLKLITYRPHTIQKKLHINDRKIRAYFGGNRSGKTTFGAVETLWWCLGMHRYRDDIPEPPIRARVCCTDFINGIKKIILPEFQKWLPEGSYHWHAEDRVLELENGSKIEMLSYDQDVAKYGGVSRHLIWMDEEPTYKALYDENMMRTVDAGGSMMLTMTPIKGLTWVYDEIYEAGNPDYVYYEVATIYDNPHLNQDEIKIIEQTMHPDEREVRLEGRFIPKSGLIYKEFDTQLHVVPYFKIPDDWTLVLGIDPHDRTPHAVVFCAINRDHDIFIFDEIFQNCLIKDLAKEMRFKLSFLNPSAVKRTRTPIMPAYSVIDTSAKTPDMISGKNYKEELGLGHGFFCVDAHKDVIAGLSKMREYLNYYNKKPNIYVMEHCRELIHQFRHYIWDDYVKKDRYNLKERPLKKDDHLLDALRYVVMTNPRWQIPQDRYKKKKAPKYRPLYESTGF